MVGRSTVDYAMAALEVLNRRIQTYENDDDALITYQQLGEEIGYLNCFGNADTHTIGNVLSAMGKMIRPHLEEQLAEAYLGSFVINAETKKPGQGMSEFCPKYTEIMNNEEEAPNYLTQIRQRARQIDWDDILRRIERAI